MAIKWLDAKRLQGTNAERLAMTELGWTVTNTAGSDVAITGGELEINSLGSASNNGSLAYHDLGSGVVDSAEWYLRWEWHFTSFTGTDSNSPSTIDVGLSSGKDGAGSAGAGGGTWSPTEDIAMIFVSGDKNPSHYFQQVNGDGAVNVYDLGGGGNTSRDNLALEDAAYFTDETYYMQLRRYDNGGTDTIEAKYFTNSNYTDGLENTTTRTANIPSGLRYIKAEIWGYTDTQSGDTAIHSEIDNLKFWNGTSTAGTPTYQTDFTSGSASYPNLPNGTIFNETDTYKYFMWNGTDTWNQMVSS